MKKIILILLFFILHFTLNIEDCECQWVSVSSGIPEGGNTYLYHINGKIFAASSGGIYISTDNGVKWQKTSFSANLSVLHYKDSCFIAAGYDGIFVSTNEGLTWMQTANSSYYFSEIITVNGNLFAANSYQIRKSTNNGFNWTTVYTNWGPITSITNNDNYIFAGLGYGEYSLGQVIYSTNEGVNWSSTGLDSIAITSMNSINGIVFAGTTSNGIFTSTNNGISWVNSCFQGYYISRIIKCQNDIYVICRLVNSLGYELFKSTNYGNNWTKINLPSASQTLSILQVNNFLLSCTEYNGIYISSDNGSNWIHYLPSSVNIIAFRKFNSRLFAGAVNDGIYCSDDGGANWIQTSINPRLTVRCFTSNGSKLFAGVNDDYSDTGGVYISYDSGINWIMSSLNRLSVYCLINTNSGLYAGGAYYGIYKSTNNGINWFRLSGLHGSVPYCFYQSGLKLFMGGFRDNHFFTTGLYYSTNEGASWDSVMNLISINEISGNTNYLFAACNGGPGILRSSNNGMNWTGSLSLDASAVTVYDNYIFAGANSNGVYMSSNNGETWTAKNEGLTSNAVSEFMIADGYIYAGLPGINRRLLSDITSAKQICVEIPEVFSLGQNYPNPFNANTIIRFQIKDSRFVNLRVFDLMGREVTTLVNERLEAGTYEVRFDAGELPSGVYFYRMETEKYTDTKKLILLK